MYFKYQKHIIKNESPHQIYLLSILLLIMYIDKIRTPNIVYKG